MAGKILNALSLTGASVSLVFAVASLLTADRTLRSREIAVSDFGAAAAWTGIALGQRKRKTQSGIADYSDADPAARAKIDEIVAGMQPLSKDEIRNFGSAKVQELERRAAEFLGASERTPRHKL